jgi:hypothetical protein
VHRFQLRPSFNELPPIRVSQREDVFVTRDGKWIGQLPPAVGEQVPERFRFWNAESGAAASLDAIPKSLGLPSEDKDDNNNATPNWIGLFPRDAPRDAALSGDRFGGEWYIDGEVGDIRIKEISSMRLVAELGSGTNWAFSRKGTWVAVVDSEEDDLILRIWPWSLDRLLDRACELLPRNLSQEEWKRFDLPKLGLGSHRDTCRRPQALK